MGLPLKQQPLEQVVHVSALVQEMQLLRQEQHVLLQRQQALEQAEQTVEDWQVAQGYVHATHSPPFIVQLVLQVVQKVELRQEQQLEGQVMQLEEESRQPVWHVVQEVELAHTRQLEGHERQLLPVKQYPDEHELHPEEEVQVAQGEEQALQAELLRQQPALQVEQLKELAKVHVAHPVGQLWQMVEEKAKQPALHWVHTLTLEHVLQPAGHPTHTPFTVKVLALHDRHVQFQSQELQLKGHCRHTPVEVDSAYPEYEMGLTRLALAADVLVAADRAAAGTGDALGDVGVVIVAGEAGGVGGGGQVEEGESKDEHDHFGHYIRIIQMGSMKSIIFYSPNINTTNNNLTIPHSSQEDLNKFDIGYSLPHEYESELSQGRILLQFNLDYINMLNIASHHSRLMRMFIHISMGLRCARSSYAFALGKFRPPLRNHQSQSQHGRSLSHKNQQLVNPEQQGGNAFTEQDQQWLDQLAKLKSIQDFMPYSKSAFSKNSRRLAQFLHKLYPLVNSQSWEAHSPFLLQIVRGLNTFSGTREINAEEFIEMLRFHAKIRELGKEMNFLHNHGFEKKAHMIAATFIYNKKLSFNQATLTIKLLVPLGGITILFYTNFIKYFKTALTDETLSKQIGPVGLLTLLQVQFAKRNYMIIEHVLFDYVLLFTLSNMQRLIQQESLTVKVDTLCTLLCIDSRYHYRTDPTLKRYWINKILNQVYSCIDKNWIFQMCNQNEGAYNHVLTLNQLTHLIQCAQFIQDNLQQYQCFSSQMGKIITRLMDDFMGQVISQKFTIVNTRKFIKFAFCRQVGAVWMKKKGVRQKIIRFMSNMLVKDERELQPFRSYIESHPSEQHPQLMELSKNIVKNHFNNRVILCSLIITLIKKTVHMDIIPKSERKEQFFFLFISRFMKQNCKLTLQANNIIPFIKNIYVYANKFHSSQGYFVALSLVQQHFDEISAVLGSKDTSSARKSEINPLLSESSFYFAWIVFNNLINVRQISNKMLLFYQRIMKNDIIKYEILTHLFEQTYPHPQKFIGRAGLKNEGFVAVMKNIVGSFGNEQKYAYFLWDLLIKMYTVQSPKVREESFELMQECFMSAYRKEKLRKVIMVNVLTSYIATGVILAPRLKLQALFETAIDELLLSEDLIEYHYNCYLHIVFNAISADILSPIYFDKIIVYSVNKEKDMKSTNSLMLMYGGSLKSRNEDGGVIDKSVNEYQKQYLLSLIKNGRIRQAQYGESPREQGVKQRRYVQITSKLISILFQFGVSQIVAIQKDITEFLEGHWDYGQWRCMVNCYTAQNYSMMVRKEALFRSAVNKIMIDKLIFFKKMKLVSKAQQSYFIDKFK